MGHRSRRGGSEHLGRLSQHTVARRGSCVAVPLLGWQQGWELTPSPWSSQPGLLSRFLYCLSTGECVSTAVWSACREGQVADWCSVSTPCAQCCSRDGRKGAGMWQGQPQRVWDVCAHHRAACPVRAIAGSAGAGCGHELHRMCWFVGSQLAHRQLKRSLEGVF